MLLVACAAAAQTPSPAVSLPPPPAHHFNDYADFVSPEEAGRLDQRLSQFERETGHQFVVAIFPRLQAASLEEFTLKTADAWAIGRKGADDGVVLFVFANDRRLRLEVGRGLEEALSNETCRRIIEERIVPAFKRGQRIEGLYAGIEAVKATLRNVP